MEELRSGVKSDCMLCSPAGWVEQSKTQQRDYPSGASDHIHIIASSHNKRPAIAPSATDL